MYRYGENTPVVRFAKGDKKGGERPALLEAAGGGIGRVALIGIAQEKASVWRSWKAKGSCPGQLHY